MEIVLKYLLNAFLNSLQGGNMTMCNCDNRSNQDGAEITNLVIRSDKLEAYEGDNAYY